MSSCLILFIVPQSVNIDAGRSIPVLCFTIPNTEMLMRESSPSSVSGVSSTISSWSSSIYISSAIAMNNSSITLAEASGDGEIVVSGLSSLDELRRFCTPYRAANDESLAEVSMGCFCFLDKTKRPVMDEIVMPRPFVRLLCLSSLHEIDLATSMLLGRADGDSSN